MENILYICVALLDSIHRLCVAVISQKHKNILTSLAFWHIISMVLLRLKSRLDAFVEKEKRSEQGRFFLLSYLWRKDMSAIVIHDYIEPDLKNLPKNENADCSKCMFAEKQYSQSEQNEDCVEYLCKAALYDIETLACFVPE